MTVTAPPRPPRRPSDPVTHGEFDALVEALIEEARQRTRRRRRRIAVIVTLVALVGVALFALLGRSAQSQTASPAFSARTNAAAQAPSSQIAFTRDPVGEAGQGHKEIYVVNPDGSGLRLLAREAGLGEIAWSPDGREILYGGLSVVKADGSGERRLSDEGYEFDWAPDGQKIAFTTVRGPYRDIHVMNADGSGQRRLVKRGLHPQWSPDARKIAFASRRDGNWEIYVINADGSGVKRLTRNPVFDGSPAWSPDGRKIVFFRNRPVPPGVYVMNPDGSGQRRLVPNAWPIWSPDGRKIAFGRDSGIYVMKADGSGQRRLSGIRDYEPRSVRGAYGPTWSPDGKKIAYVRGKLPPFGKPDIYVMNADGSEQQKLLHTYVTSLAWSPAQR